MSFKSSHYKIGTALLLIFSCFFSFQVNVLAVSNNVEQTIHKLDKEIEANMRTHDIPGMAFAWVTKEKGLYTEGFGLLEINEEAAVNEQTNFLLGSLSKVFVTLAVLQLQEQGKLDVEQPLVHYLPWFTTDDTTISNQITVRHLLNHSSGLPDRLNMHDAVSLDKEDRIKQMIQKLSNVSLTHSPGEGYEYTNMNTDLLQVLIEETTGEPFTSYMEEHIFKPLGMERTGYFSYNNSHLTNSAIGHRYHWGRLKPYNESLSYATSGSAGLSSNVDDLAKFIGYLLNEDEGSTGLQLSRKSMLQMFQPNQYGSGFNWYVTPHNIYMEGGLPGMTSTLVLAADRSFGLVLLSNSKQDITLNSGFNLYRIIAGGSPSTLLVADYPKISSITKLIMLVTLFVTLALALLVASMIISLWKGSRTLRFKKPSGMSWITIGILSIVYMVMLVYIYVYLPFEIGVPTLYDYHKDPDIVQGLTIFLIMLTVLMFTAIFRILFFNKAPLHKQGRI